MYNFYEFFAGGGMARAGFGPRWQCLFSNDFDHKKAHVYKKNWGDTAFKLADVKDVKSSDIPGQSDVVWASFPCQDLSLAGGGAGLRGDRSGTFWPFWALMKSLIKEDRAPSIIALENVCGTLTSHGGEDFTAICMAFVEAGYRCGAVVIDAALFVPQSRPRLFIIGVKSGLVIPPGVTSSTPHTVWHTPALRSAYERLTSASKGMWVWWTFPQPHRPNALFHDIIEEIPTGVAWHTPAETTRLLSMMSEVNQKKLQQARRHGRSVVGTVYKRTRLNESGIKVQRAEARFDNVAGCLRTPAGGSSRQIILMVDGESVKSRLISTRETARLMGLPDEYHLPDAYNEAYHLTGDGVVVPVVSHIVTHILEPIIDAQTNESQVTR